MAMSARKTPAMHGDSVMLLSFAHRDALSAQLAALGCRVTAARRIAGIERRFAVSQAAPFIVDVRDASEEGIAAIARLAPVVEAQGGALIAVYERRKKALLPVWWKRACLKCLPRPFPIRSWRARCNSPGVHVADGWDCRPPSSPSKQKPVAIH
jgi:hypothetical protein